MSNEIPPHQLSLSPKNQRAFGRRYTPRKQFTHRSFPPEQLHLHVTEHDPHIHETDYAPFGRRSEVIDLTTPEWKNGKEFVNDEAIETVNGGQDTTGEEINVDIASDKVAETNDTLEDGVGIEVDNSEKPGGNDKLYSNKMEDAKGKSLAGKSKVAAEKGKAKRKIGNVENKEIRGKRAVVKRKKAEKTGKGKMKNVDVEDENVRDKHTESVDGESTDDDFVSSKKLKTNTVAVKKKKKPRSATNIKGKCNAETENGIEKEMAGTDKVDQVNRVQARNPPKKIVSSNNTICQVDKKNL